MYGLVSCIIRCDSEAMAVPKSWDQVDDSISAALRQIVEREEKATRWQLQMVGA